ncbi:TetR/AcrR family transcriptional regulator [Nonomuraea dietziae]|uniref:TetR/AcrR family transcriptional regulator n=1 Tax=Nonomuraea dietziae TaxID=65515 RepID=UPI003407752D
MDANRHERRRREIHDRILRAALELFLAQGLDQTTIEQICERADVANRTFFNHFPNRQDLVRALGARGFRDVHASLRGRADQPVPVRLVGLFDDVADQLDGRGAAYRDVVGAMFAAAGTGVERGSDLYATFLQLIKDGVAGGEVTDRHDPQTLADVVVGGLMGGIVNWTADETYAIRSGLHDVAVALADLLTPARTLGSRP